NCRRELGVAAQVLVRLTEEAPSLSSGGSMPADTRRKLLMLAGQAVSGAFRDTILEPMVEAASLELSRIVADEANGLEKE
ncbi:hypothetical protein ACFL59_15235, partial [Planctomycetota bacterium]